MSVDHRLLDLRTQWIGKYVTVSNGNDGASGVVVDVKINDRPDEVAEGWPYIICLDWGFGMPWCESTVIEEAAR